MSTLADKLTMCADGTEAPLYVDDVFSTYLYTGNGSTQAITNGIDLVGEGGLVWTKQRSGSADNILYDTQRGNFYLRTDSTTAQGSSNSFTPNSDGFTWNNNNGLNNADTQTYTSWTFRKAPRFFDVVTYTGNGGTKVISHFLGSIPGMIIVKRTDTVGDWPAYHRSVLAKCGFLNTTGSFVSAQRFSSVTATDFTINVSTADCNANGGTYVAYLFAHDTTSDGLIQCGSCAGDTGTVVNLGWEPQWVLVKRSSTSGDGWTIHDNMRGMSVSGSARLWANVAEAESVNTSSYVTPTATGFTLNVGNPGTTYIYLAIRRPNKPPESGSEVYNAIARTGTGVAATITGVGFAQDLIIPATRPAAARYKTYVWDRLRGVDKTLATDAINGETSYTLQTSFNMGGFSLTNDAGREGINSSSVAAIFWNFRRAPGFFDVVCYTGAVSTVNHNLGVVPELIIVKSRFTIGSWMVDHKDFGTGMYAFFNTNGAEIGPDSTIWNSTKPTSTVFSTGTSALTNGSGRTYVAYLFATLPGISKVDSYIGNGSNQIINCGFAAGARFILIKRTDLTGDWYVWDTTRGIVAANDPHLSLNTTAAEATNDDSIDPASSGFIVNQVAATNINVLNGNYIFLAIA